MKRQLLLALVLALVWPPGTFAVVARAASGTASGQEAVSLRPAVSSLRMYLIALGDSGKPGLRIGCGDSLIAVTRPIPPTRAPLIAAYRLLLGDHHKFYGQSGLYNPLYQARATLQRATVQNGRAAVYLTGRLNLRGVCDDPRVTAQLRHTALQFPNVHSVATYLNGVPLRKVLSGKGK